MTTHNGTSGSVLNGTTDLNITDWKATFEVTDQDLSNQVSSGWHVASTGKKKISGSCTAYYDAAIHGATPALIKPGSSVTLKLERYAGDSSPCSGTAVITSLDYDHSYDTVFTFTMNFTYSGAVTGFPIS